MNVYQAWQAAANSVKQTDEDTSLCILQDENHLATLTTYIVLPIDIDLYHAALQPFDRLLQARGRRNHVNLLASVFTYLANIHRIKFFHQRNSFLHSYYELIKDEGYFHDRADRARIAGQIDSAFQRSKHISHLFKNPHHLAQFSERLTRFRPKNQHDQNLLTAASLAEELYRRYPNRCILDSIQGGIADLENEDDPDEMPPFDPHQYLHFTWTKFDDLGEMLNRWLENDYQELATMERPMNWQIFDKPQYSITLSLDFERLFFDMILKFIIYLNQIE